MKILMIGGTGNISTALSELLLRQGHDLHLYCLDRSTQNNFNLRGAKFQYGNINDEAAVQVFLKNNTFEVVVDWTVMLPEQANRDIRLFAGHTAQYILISSASAYQKPPRSHVITEETPLENPYWEYSRNKAKCEEAVMTACHESGFPATVVRPSLTYGDAIIPYVLCSWEKPWSLIHRIRSNQRIIVPGDGTSLWVITHNTDFAKGIVGLMGKQAAVGQAFHITSDEVLTWNGVLQQIGWAVGVEPRPVHISSEFIEAILPEQTGNLSGDKNVSAVFDNSKLKRVVPEFKATMSFRDGIARTVAYLDSRPEMHSVDTAFEGSMDRVIAAHDAGLKYAESNR